MKFKTKMFTEILAIFFCFLIVISSYYIKIGSFFALNTTDNNIIRKIRVSKCLPNISKNIKDNIYLSEKYYFDSQIMSNNQITNFSNGLKLWFKILYFGDFYI